MAPRDVDRLKDQIEELFADLWQVPRFSGSRRGFRPAVDCFRTSDPPTLTIVAELAGADPGSLQIVVDGRRLLIAGERPRPRADGQSYEQLEIEYGPFQRHVALAEDVDVEAAVAAFENGLLRIELPVARRPARNVSIPVAVRRGE